MRYMSFNRRDQRQGVVLLVVIAMLTLFAAVGLAFVFYAESEATAANLTVQAGSKSAPDADPELLLSYFLSQFIYGTNNPGSAIRGHDLGTTMFGNNPNALNAAAYSGTERLHYPLDATANQLAGLDNYYYPNCQVYTNDGFRRDPEFYGTTASPSYGYRAGNAPYTYPDMSNMFLARVDADGSVIAPSFRRQWAEQVIGPDLVANPARRRYAFLYPDGMPGVGYHNGLDGKGNALNTSSGQPLGSFNPVDADAGGYVRNLDFSRGFLVGYANGSAIYANNDSYWLDLGWPVMTAPNGKKYKALFAPLITDLDNRINLWVSGNQAGANVTHVSNQGYGTTEINLNRVVATQAELNWLFGKRPYSGQPPNLPTRDGPNYARIDANGVNGGKPQLPGTYGKAPNNLFVFPNYQQYPANPWYSTVPPELQNHPLGFNYFGAFSSANNRPYRASNSEAILRYLGTGAPAATSSLFKNMPNTFASPSAANPGKTRNLLTALSASLDRIQAAPFINFNPATGVYAYNAIRRYPIGAPSLTQTDYSQPAPNFGTSEFTLDYRSKLANRVRINLNRISSSAYDYPSPDSDLNEIVDYPNNSGKYPNAKAQFDKAQAARISLAADIYQVFVLATGAQDPNKLATESDVNSTQFQAARWLAQLSVNIVDYIDNDDFITPYPWYSKPANSVFPNNPALEFAYGTEVPRLVLSEVYAQLDNNPADAVNLNDPTTWKATGYSLNVWAELLNPFTNSSAGNFGATADPFPYEGGNARLKVQGYDKTGNVLDLGAAYQVVLSKPNDPNLTVVSNTRGDYTPVQTPAASVANDMDQGSIAFVAPANGNASGLPGPPVAGKLNGYQGYYVLAPKANFLGAVTVDMANNVMIGSRDPGLTATSSYQSKGMSWQYGVADVDPTKPLPSPTVLLQRLACPYLKWNDPYTAGAPNDPTAPYNPFVTVDYVTNTKTNNNVVFNGAGPLLNSLPPDQINVKFSTVFASQGRRQPYAAARLFDQTVVNLATQPKNTFFAANLPSDAPFNWLVQLDRPVVNAMELLHVSGFYPYQLTQQFITFNPNGTENLLYQHYAPWQDPQAMIYRALELFGVPNNLLGTSMGGRVPGKININTLNENINTDNSTGTVWGALCDQRGGVNGFSSFQPNDVNTLFSNLIQSRTPNQMAGSNGLFVPGQSDRPFKPFATGFIPNPAIPPPFAQYPGGAGLDDTLLRTTTAVPNQLVPQPATQSLYGNLALGVPNQPNVTLHPYQRTELLQKIFNNVGTTSNVFAVWLTVGFFEVQDVDAAGNAIVPAKIGSEIGRDQGRQVRHRMFAIVDRTNMQLFSTSGTYNAATQQLTLATPNGVNLPQGTTLLLDVSQNTTEVVAVTASANNNWTFTASLQTIGTGNVTVTCRGNPGPQPAYNPRNDPLVVPHFTIIQ
jgi:hypothetical protein